MTPISVTGQHFKVTDPLKDYVHQKLERLERHCNDMTNVHVVLTVENKIDQIARANVDVKGGTLNVSTKDENMYAAIDKMIDELDRQAIRHKEKRSNHRHDGDSLKDFNGDL